MVINISTNLIFRNLPASSSVNNDPDGSAVASRNRAEEGVYFRPENYQMLTDLIGELNEERKISYLAQNGPSNSCSSISSPPSPPLPPPTVFVITPPYIKKDGTQLKKFKIIGDYLPLNQQIDRIELSDGSGNIIDARPFDRKNKNIIEFSITIDQNTRAGTYGLKIFRKWGQKTIEMPEALKVAEKTQPVTPLEFRVSSESVVADNFPHGIMISGEHVDKANNVKVVDGNNNILSNQALVGSPNEKTRAFDLQFGPAQLVGLGLTAHQVASGKRYDVSLVISYSDGTPDKVHPFTIIDERHPTIVMPEKLGADNTSHNVVVFGPGLDQIDAMKIFSNSVEVFSSPVNESNSQTVTDDRIITMPVRINPQSLPGGTPDDSEKAGRTNYNAAVVLYSAGTQVLRRDITLYSDLAVQPTPPALPPVIQACQPPYVCLVPPLTPLLSPPILGVPSAFHPNIEKAAPVGDIEVAETGRVPLYLGFTPQIIGDSPKAWIKKENETAEKIVKNDELKEFIAAHKDKYRYDDSTETLVIKGEMNKDEKNELLTIYSSPEEKEAINRLFSQSKNSFFELNLQTQGSLFIPNKDNEEYKNGFRFGGNVLFTPAKWFRIEAQGQGTWSGSGSTMNLPYFYGVVSRTGKFKGAVHFNAPDIFRFKLNVEYTDSAYRKDGKDFDDSRWRGTGTVLADLSKSVKSTWAPSRISANGGFILQGSRNIDGEKHSLGGGGFISQFRWDRGVFSDFPFEPYFGIEWEKGEVAWGRNTHFGVKFNIMDFLRNTAGTIQTGVLPPSIDIF
ncbi:MAG: hypothetical protein WC632_03270 [Candidatus Margulisiibacteriota bacterium]